MIFPGSDLLHLCIRLSPLSLHPDSPHCGTGHIASIWHSRSCSVYIGTCPPHTPGWCQPPCNLHMSGYRGPEPPEQEEILAWVTVPSDTRVCAGQDHQECRDQCQCSNVLEVWEEELEWDCSWTPMNAHRRTIPYLCWCIFHIGQFFVCHCRCRFHKHICNFLHNHLDNFQTWDSILDEVSGF